MEEGQVSIEGATRSLPSPFFVIATQNPLSQAGTYPLPESQLDRFLMRISLGYPTKSSELQLFQGIDPRERLKTMQPKLTTLQLMEIQQQVDQVKASSQLLDYLQRLVEFTRADDVFSYGLSTRGALGYLRAAKAWALIHEREYVVPEDLQDVAGSVVGHRVIGVRSQVGGKSDSSMDQLVSHMLSSVDVVEV